MLESSLQIEKNNKEQKIVDNLLQDRKKFSDELYKIKETLNNMEVYNSDSENITEQQLNNEISKEFLIKRVSELKTKIKGIDNQLNEIQEVKSN